MSDPTVVKILIMALGGQGGGVLTEWLFQACLLEDYPVRSTSIPGVSQRTGSTSYYLEVPTRTRRDLGDRRPEFCLYPTAGDVDLVEESWEQSKRRLSSLLASQPSSQLLELLAEVERRYPERLWRTLAEALYRLIDYQDAAYARRYLDRLERVRQVEERVGGAASDRLTEIVARSLAVWMTYEDAIRVAQFKIRPERFARIAREAGASPDQAVTVTEYLKPDIEEILGVLPKALVGRLARWAERRWPGEDKPTLGQTIESTSFPGFLRLWLVTRLRPLRPISVRFAHEHAVISEYLHAVERYGALDLDLGCAVARLAQVVKGYGNVRRRTLRQFARVLREIVTPLADAEVHQRNGFPVTREAVERARTLLLAQPEGLEPALAAVPPLLERLRTQAAATPALAPQ